MWNDIINFCPHFVKLESPLVEHIVVSLAAPEDYAGLVVLVCTLVKIISIFKRYFNFGLTILQGVLTVNIVELDYLVVLYFVPETENKHDGSSFMHDGTLPRLLLSAHLHYVTRIDV